MPYSKYSDEEVSTLLHELFLEKKKVQTLELEKINVDPVPASSQEPYLKDEVLFLRSQIETLKKKLLSCQTPKPAPLAVKATEKLLEQIQEKDQEILRLKEFEIAHKKVIGQIRHLEQLHAKAKKEALLASREAASLKKQNEEMAQQKKENQRSFESLKARFDESENKKAELEEENQKISLSFNRLKDEAAHYLQAFEKIDASFKEKTGLLEHASQELFALQGQYGKLRDCISGLKQQTSEQKRALEEKDLLLARLSQEKEALEKSLRDLDKESEQMKQSLGKTLRETQELEGQYLDVLQEKTATINRNVQLQQQIEKQRGEITNIREEITELISQKAEVQKENAQLLLQLENEKLHSEELSQQNEKEQKEKKWLQEEFTELKNLAEETDSHLKMAQQHLAKKMKEITQLTEKFDEQTAKLQESELAKEASILKIREIEAQLENALQTEKKIQEQFNERIKGLEFQAEKWEQKYISAMEKAQKLEGENRELQKINDKYLDLKSLLSNLTQAIGPQGSFPAPTPKELEPVMIVQKEEIKTPKIEEVKELAKETSLFESTPQFKLKDSLFD